MYRIPRSRASSGRCAWLVSSLLHTQANDALFDEGFAERDVVHDETSAGRQIQAEEKRDKFPFVYGPFKQIAATPSHGTDRYNGSSPSPKPCTILTGEMRASRIISVRRIMLLPVKGVASIATKRKRFAFQREIIHGHERILELST